MKIKLPYFGNVTINKNLVEQDYQVYEKFNDTLIELNLIYETENLNQSDLLIVKEFLDNVEEYMINAKENILNNYSTNSEIQEFIKIHIDALTPLAKEVLNEIIPKDTLLENYFLEDLELAKIYIFADDKDEFVKFIYEISEEITDEKLFVRFDKELILKEIATEY
jgi:hypothetical protein